MDYCRDGDVETLVNRMVAVEKGSWKGMSDQGVDHGLPLQFYREIMASLLRKGTFRGVFIRNDTEDLSFAFGGIEGTVSRFTIKLPRLASTPSLGVSRNLA